MPRTEVVFYQEDEGDVPVLDWLKELRFNDQRAYETCVAAIERLAEFGHETKETPCGFVCGDGIYELRIRKGPRELQSSLFLSRKELGDPWSRA